MISFDLSNEQFDASLNILKAEEPLNYNQLLLSFAAANPLDVDTFFEDYKVAPLDMPHFFEPTMFASFVVGEYFKIFAHFETNGGFATGNVKPMAFWKPSYLMI